jgi:hypothetical protein
VDVINSDQVNIAYMRLTLKTPFLIPLRPIASEYSETKVLKNIFFAPEAYDAASLTGPKKIHDLYATL